MAQKKVVVYSCDPTCVADVKHKKIKARKPVYLLADGTDVTLQFTNSPFNPPLTTVNIPMNTFVKLTAGARAGSFPYSLTCSRCGTRQDEPSMIIEL